MDQNLPPTAPSTTVPSDQGEHISNLSTRPNLYEENDSYDARVIDHSHHSQSIHYGRENNQVPQHPEQQSSNHSQGHNKAHSQPLIDNSIFHNLNQNVSQLLQSQNSNDRKIQVERRLQLTTFDQNWQSDLKKQQADRQEYHELFHENNELLLTQKVEDEFMFTEKESHLLEVVEQDKRSDVSNEVMVNQFISKAPEIIFEEQSHSSRSVMDQPLNPLFQNAVKDQSQSNLLDFGFSRQSKTPNHTWTIRPEPIIFQPQSQNSTSIQIAHNNDSSVSSLNQVDNRVTSIQVFSTISQIGYKEPQQPMIIEETVQNSQSKHSSRYHSDHSSKNSSKHSNQMIKIEVHDCKEEVIDSYTKNNDIYGIMPKQQASFVEKQQSQIWRNDEEYVPENIAQNEDTNEQKQAQQSSQIVFKEEQKQNYPLSQTYEIKHQQQQRRQPQETIEQIMEKLNFILQSNIPEQQKAQEGGKLLENHINFLFLTPLTDIGTLILSDGNYCVVLIKIVLMKETDSVTKGFLQKYLCLTFASKISKGHNRLIQYQQSSLSISNVQSEPYQKPKIKQSQSLANHTTHDTFNESVYAEHGSVAINSNEKMVIDNENEPVKRTLVTRQPVALKSQKPTRKTRLKTKGKGKGKTTAKKSAVKFETDSNQSPPKQQVQGFSQIEIKSSKNSFRKNRESDKILNDSFNTGDAKGYGSKFTFILRDNLKSKDKQLVQLRKSQRIAKKTNSQAKQHSQSRVIRSQKSPNLSPDRKIQRLSGNKIFMYDQIDINYIKKNMQDLTLKNVIMLEQFNALTPEDEEILNIINDYYEALSNQRRSIDRPSREQAHEQHRQDSTNSLHNQEPNPNSNIDSNSHIPQEVKEKLSKYSISQKGIIVQRVVNPNINNHGIYALLELDRSSFVFYGARYALTPITNLSRASKRLIDEDLKTAMDIAQVQLNNFAFVQTSESILKQISKVSKR